MGVMVLHFCFFQGRVGLSHLLSVGLLLIFKNQLQHPLCQIFFLIVTRLIHEALMSLFSLLSSVAEEQLLLSSNTYLSLSRWSTPFRFLIRKLTETTHLPAQTRKSSVEILSVD